MYPVSSLNVVVTFFWVSNVGSKYAGNECKAVL